MSDPFLGEVRAFAFTFAPVGWARCDGQILPISQNTALWALLGTTYGGDGKSTFALPDLRGRVTIGEGDAPALRDYTLGESGGADTVKVIPTRMPFHTHALMVSKDVATERQPPNQLFAVGDGVSFYDVAAPNDRMDPQAVASTGGGQAHDNLQPYTTLLYCIAIQGEFPQP